MDGANWKGHTNMQLVQWGRLTYYTPESILRDLHTQAVEKGLQWEALPQKAQEHWMAAMFAFAIQECIIKQPVGVCWHEDEDYDCVLSWDGKKNRVFRPVQLKELPPTETNSRETLHRIIQKLEKYVGSLGLTVAIFAHREGRILYPLKDAKKSPVAEIWLFGCCDPAIPEWELVGDFKTSPKSYKFRDPRQPSQE